MPNHRWVNVDPLQYVNTRETLERKERTKRALRKAAQRIASSVGYSTTALRKSSNSDQSSRSPPLSHLTSSGTAHMIDVGNKKETHRSATAVCHLLFSHSTTLQALTQATLKKGDALAVARIAGIQAAKKTADLIPLAHPALSITAINIDVEPFEARSQNDPPPHVLSEKTGKPSSATTNSFLRLELPFARSDYGGICVVARVECYGKTGVEMEALTAANVATLTMYDMLKGVDKAMLITGCRVVEKLGGKSGSWRWNRKQKKFERLSNDALPTDQDRPQQYSEAVDCHTSVEQQHHNPSTLAGPSISATTLASPPPFSTNQTSLNEDDPQSILEAEWATFTESFNTSEPTDSSVNINTADREIGGVFHPFSTSQSKASNETPSDIRGMLSGDAHGRCDAAGFERARIQRYEEWRKNR